MDTNSKLTSLIRSVFGETGFIPLHEPRFRGNEKKYLNECIDSGFVSSVGAFVTRFEEEMCRITGAKYAVATVNGTAAIHIGLVALGVDDSCEVLTQALTFVATGNAIAYTGARPRFIDVDETSMGMSASALEAFLKSAVELDDEGTPYNKENGRRIAACVPMHTFGMPCDIEAIISICDEYNIPVLEDAAEAIGSLKKGKSCGTFGVMGTFSFNGNKVVTAGGGGAVVTDNEALAKHLKHLTTTAKVPHRWEYVHDFIGYNYRMPNVNAALVCAQLEQLDTFLAEKRALAEKYKALLQDSEIEFIDEPENCKANFWLIAIRFSSEESRDEFLQMSNDSDVMTRPAWEPLHQLSMFMASDQAPLPVTENISSRIVNIPSSAMPSN